MLLKAGPLPVKTSSALSSSHLSYVFPAASRVLCSVTSNSLFCTSPGHPVSWKHLPMPAARSDFEEQSKNKEGIPTQSTGLSAALSNRSEGSRVRALPACPSACSTVLPAPTSKCPKTPCKPARKPWVLFKAAYFNTLQPQEKHQVMNPMKSHS